MAEIPFEAYTGQSKLRFWCQKVLPLVYDESLSYYELLNKVVYYLNNTITDVSACEDNITALRDAFVHLQDYVNEVLDDFAPEVERVIDEMIDSGEFGEILADLVNGLIANEYSTTQGYAQFDYVIKDGKLYCAIVSTSGEWDATKWRETTVGTDMQLLSQRLYNLNAGQVAYNEEVTYDNNTVGKKLKDLDNFGDNLNAGQVAFDESASYGNNTVGKKLKDLDDFDDNLNAGQVAFDESATYDNNTVGKKLKDLDDFDDNLNAGQVAFDESATYGNNTVGKELQDLNNDKIDADATELNDLSLLGYKSLFFITSQNVAIGSTGISIPPYSRCAFINFYSNDGALFAITTSGTVITAFRNNGTWINANQNATVTDVQNAQNYSYEYVTLSNKSGNAVAYKVGHIVYFTSLNDFNTLSQGFETIGQLPNGYFPLVPVRTNIVNYPASELFFVEIDVGGTIKVYSASGSQSSRNGTFWAMWMTA